MTLLADLVATSTRVGETSARLAKVASLASLLRTLRPEEVDIAVAYLSGATRQGKLGIGYAALSPARHLAPSSVPHLTLSEVDEALGALAGVAGRGAATERARRLETLFSRATVDEQTFLARLFVGELRQGALEGLMIEAVAAAADVPAARVRQAAMVAGGIAAVATAALARGASGLERFAMALFQPFAPMLAQPADDIATALAALGTAALEWKLDGARVQVHKSGDDVRIYTRSANDVTVAAPEIVEAVREASADDLILDGEAIALRPDGAPHPFQVTMRRFGRSLEVDRMRETLPLAVLFFDCLRRDGRDLATAPGHARFAELARALPSTLLVPRLVTGDLAAAQAFYDDAVGRGHEGVMAKALDAPYEAGARSAQWLKVKRAHTLDLVVLAAEWGHGRRSGKLSNLHLGARDPATGTFVMLGKTFKGMTDAMLAWQTGELLARETGRDGHVVHVRPELVVEITFNDVQASPRYPGGLALRFARVKGYRPDKRAGEADTIETVRAIHALQSPA